MTTQILNISDVEGFGNAVLGETENLRLYFSNLLDESGRIIFQNLIDETKNEFIDGTSDNKVSFKKRYESLHTLNKKWFSAHKEYKNDLKAVNLIDVVTNYITAYSYFILSLHLINEEKTGDYYLDSNRVIEGLELLAELVEVFHTFLNRSELTQILSGVESILSELHPRSTYEYFNEGREKNSLTTRLKALCTLISVDLRGKIDAQNRLEKNQGALKLFDSWNCRSIDDDDMRNTKEDFERFKKIIDSYRPYGQKVFS